MFRPSLLPLLPALLLLLCVCAAPALGQCDGCEDGAATVGCPFPELCGFASISCVGCSPVPTSGCPHPAWCANVSCSSSCMDSMPMPGCLDPGACGFKPTACKGCVVGQQRDPGCPDPTWCVACADAGQCPVHDSPPCWRCVAGQSTPSCPNATACGVLAPSASSSSSSSAPPPVLPPSASCSGCVPNSSTVGCPNVTACGGVSTWPCIACEARNVSMTCPDPSWCGLAPACIGCVEGRSSVGCPNLAACTSALSNCSHCVDRKPTAQCPDPGRCGFAPVSCVDCMAGMAMPNCPYPEYCPPSSGGTAGDGDGAVACPMQMFFTSSDSVCVLLSSWHVHSPAQWLLLVAVIGCMAACRELLIAHRQHRERQRRVGRMEEAAKAREKEKAGGAMSFASPHHGLSRPLMAADAEADGSPSPATFAFLTSADVVSAVVDGLYYSTTLLLAYLLMLLVMSYNVAVIVAVIAASTVAHVAIGLTFTAAWKREAAARRQRVGEERGSLALAQDREAERLQRLQGGLSPAAAPSSLPLDPIDDLTEQATPRPASEPCCADIEPDTE